MGENSVIFETKDKIVKYSSDIVSNGISYAFAYGGENFSFMLHRKLIRIQEYATSTDKNQSHYSNKKDEELKGDNFTDENESIIEYGNDFENCKIISA